MKNELFFLFVFFLLAITFPGRCQNVKTGYITAGNLRVYYERTGKGDAIILLHAGLQDHTMWKEQVKTLSARYEVITPDLPFHGKTSGTDTVLLAQDVIRILMDSFHLQKVSIAGLSMGAAVTLDFMIAYPQLVNKAILISAGINGFDKSHPIDSLSMQWYYLFNAALKEKDTAKAAGEFARAWAEGIYRSKDSLRAPVSNYVYSTTLHNLRLHKMAGWPLLQNHPPAIEGLPNLRIPVLVINGDKDLPYIIVASDYLEKNIAGAKHVVIKNVAHMLNMEKPEELNILMLNFLKR